MPAQSSHCAASDLGLHFFLCPKKDALPTWMKEDLCDYRGGSRNSGKGVHMYKGLGVRFVDFISFSLISHENEIIWSH